jgi:hypothetical protein
MPPRGDPSSLAALPDEKKPAAAAFKSQDQTRFDPLKRLIHLLFFITLLTENDNSKSSLGCDNAPRHLGKAQPQQRPLISKVSCQEEEWENPNI